VDRFASPAEFREYFKALYGPTIAVYDAAKEDAQPPRERRGPERSAALDRGLAVLAERFGAGGAMEWEYLLVTARRH
jgi:hypothetical protein